MRGGHETGPEHARSFRVADGINWSSGEWRAAGSCGAKSLFPLLFFSLTDGRVAITARRGRLHIAGRGSADAASSSETTVHYDVVRRTIVDARVDEPTRGGRVARPEDRARIQYRGDDVRE